MEFTQVRLLVKDFARCYRFYSDVLGLRPQLGAVDGPYEIFTAEHGGGAVALHERAQMGALIAQLTAPPTGHRALVVFRVGDLDQSCRAVVEHGVPPAAGPVALTEDIRAAHLSDPEGNLIELQQWG